MVLGGEYCSLADIKRHYKFLRLGTTMIWYCDDHCWNRIRHRLHLPAMGSCILKHSLRGTQQGARRLLLMDGHGSHHTSEIIKFYEDHKIKTVGMPFHLFTTSWWMCVPAQFSFQKVSSPLCKETEQALIPYNPAIKVRGNTHTLLLVLLHPTPQLRGTKTPIRCEKHGAIRCSIHQPPEPNAWYVSSDVVEAACQVSLRRLEARLNNPPTAARQPSPAGKAQNQKFSRGDFHHTNDGDSKIGWSFERGGLGEGG